jgi:hypothetical protein
MLSCSNQLLAACLCLCITTAVVNTTGYWELQDWWLHCAQGVHVCIPHGCSASEYCCKRITAHYDHNTTSSCSSRVQAVLSISTCSAARKCTRDVSASACLVIELNQLLTPEHVDIGLFTASAHWLFASRASWPVTVSAVTFSTVNYR